MSALPFISHHLFVAAVGQDNSDASAAAVTTSLPLTPGDRRDVTNVSLNLMEDSRPLPSGPMRPLRVSGAWVAS
jgi:hypothetical protein